MKLVFANRFFHPDLAPTGRLASQVAFDAAAHGHDVHAVTSRQRYEDAAKIRDQMRKLKGEAVATPQGSGKRPRGRRR